MTFGPFVALLVLGEYTAIVIHFAIGYRVLDRFDGFMVKWIAGWIGGWLGSAVFGHWAYNIQSVYILPALLGAFSLTFFGNGWLESFRCRSCHCDTAKSRKAVRDAEGKLTSSFVSFFTRRMG